MAMIKCPECGKEMSDRAPACPNCGCPIDDIKDAIEIKARERREKKEKAISDKLVRKRRKASAKVTSPQVKKKRITAASIIVASVIVIGICIWIFAIKIPRNRAYQEYVSQIKEYNEGAQKYNEAAKGYNDKAKEVISVNDNLDQKIKSSQELIDCGETPYEGDKITALSNTVKEARNSKEATPELIEYKDMEQEDSALEQAGKSDIESATLGLKNALDKITGDITTIKTNTESLNIPNYDLIIENLSVLSKELEDSYSIEKQITTPAEDWVITRLGRVPEIANIAPVTEDHDPNGNLNKAGGYTSTVYFGSTLLGTEGLTGSALIDKGTDAGGAIETYSTVEDAESRDSYLGALDGGIFTSGSHMVLGTMVVRTSNDLKASQQQTLTNSIVNAMISLD